MKPNNIPKKRSWKVGLIVLLMSVHFAYGQNNGKSTTIDSTAIRQQNRSKALLFQAAASTTNGGAQVMAAVGTLPTTYNYYVSTSGNDNNAGTQAAPLRTIQAAINKAAAGQAIKVADGRYIGCINFNGKSIKLVGNPNSPESVIIDGNGQGRAVVMDRPLTTSTLLCGFTITGGQTLTDVYPDNNGAAIYMYNNANPLLSDLIITGNSSHGAIVMAMHSSSPVIQNSLFYGNTPVSGSSVLRFNNGSFTKINNITIAENGDAASIGLIYSSSIEMHNSIIYGSATSPYEVTASNSAAYMGSISYAYFYYNNIRGGTSLFYNYQNQGVFTASNTINVAPGFVDAQAGKYQLAAGSACIDAGNPAAEWNDVNRPPSRGTERNDLGMYGWQVSAQDYQTGGSTPPGEDDKPPVIINPSNRNYIHTIIPQIKVDEITTDARSPSQYSEAIEYFDGLGRPMQSVAIGATPEGFDLVTPVVYDKFGREAKKYLPYPADTNDGSYKDLDTTHLKTFYAGAQSGIAGGDARPWSQAIFEPSPLNRVTEQYGPGKKWKDSNKRQRIAYGTNTATEVRLWVASASQVATTKSYDANTLYKTEGTDEDDRVTITYTDLQERVVRQRQLLTSGKYADTDYCYDEYGRLAYVIPPAISKASDKTLTITSPDFLNYVYAYKYDERGRVIEKFIPGAGWTRIVYNKLDQPVLTQDALQKDSHEWTYTKYDAHGRVVVSGLFKPGADLYTNGTLKTNVYNATSQWEERNSAKTGYTNNAYPTANCTELLVNFYDEYGFTSKPALAHTGYSTRTHGLPTGSKAMEIGGTTALFTVIYYDEKGRVICTASDQLDDKWDKIINTYDFTGKLLTSTRNHNNTFTLVTTNSYDHAGRLTAVQQQIGANNITVAENTYNELGQLTETKHHRQSETDWLETIGYGYNIRGWLDHIDGEHFKEYLHYHVRNTSLKNTEQWGGNISAAEWYAPARDLSWHAFAFAYDTLSRLKTGIYKRSNNRGSGYTVSSEGIIEEEFTYDIMGNIKILERWQAQAATWGQVIDYLTYDYTGNQVTRVTDETWKPAGFSVSPTNYSSYSYDKAGRIKTDSQKGITSITYNHLSLPASIKKGSQAANELKYTYDGAGRKLKKQLGTGTARYYMDGVEYAGNDLQFVLTPYGRIRKEGTAWTYDYFLKDHLGNVRVVLSSDLVNTTTYMATMEESKAAEENLYFENVESTRADRPYNYPDINPLNTKLSKVPGKSEGLKLTLKVMAGDTIEISAKAFYNIDNTMPGKSIDVAPMVGNVIVAMTSPTGVVMSEAAQTAISLGAEASQSVSLVQLPTEEHPVKIVQPKSGLNFVLYNEGFEVIEENTGYLPVDDKINAIQILATDKLVMTESGYIEIFVDNQAQTPVYYDNLIVVMSGGTTREVNAYYPSGLIITELSTTATTGANAYKYNGKELQTEHNLNWLDYGDRMYAWDYNRWPTPDPLAENHYDMSPYAFSGNNPVNNIDPDGLDWYSFLEEYQDEKGEIQTRPRYMYYSGRMSDKQVEKGGYTHIGETISVDNGDGTYTNFYQNVGLKSDQVFDAKEYMLDNDLVGKYAYDEKSPLDMYARVDLAQAAIHKGQDDFLNHEFTQLVLKFLPLKGIFNLDKRLGKLGLAKEHTSNARPSTVGKHQLGKARKAQDYGGEKGDISRRPPRQKPPNWKGPWPPKTTTN